jgi:Na+/H+ antiporter NhaD/arsenite permease-like protein
MVAQVAEHAVPHVSGPVTALFTVLLVAMIASLALEEKLHAKKSLIVGLYAVVSLLLGAILLPLPYGPYVIGGHDITMPVFIPAVDWGVITIILGASLFVDVTSRSGLFTWIAIRLTKASGGDPLRLLWFYGVMTVVFSAVLNNVTAMIIVGSLTAVSLDRLDRNDKLLGFLLVEGLLTNVGGLLTLISSVPNIIVGTAAHISFVSFFVRASPFVAVTTVVTLLMGARVFGVVGLPDEESRAEALQLVSGFDEKDGIESQGFFWFAAAMLVLFIVAIATTSVLPYVSDLGMGFVALAFALIMLVPYKNEVDQFYRTVDWDLLGFFGALFIVINVMEHAQVLGLIGVGLEHIIDLGPTVGTGAVMVATAFFSAVTDNIPLAAILAKIIAGIPMADGLARAPTDPLWWAVIFGANLGGNITPIGSASTLVAVTIIHKHGLHLTFVGFVKKALPFALVQIAIAAVYVLWFL